MYSYSKEYRNSIRTCAELTKFDSDMCRTYKIRFRHVQNLQKSIRTCTAPPSYDETGLIYIVGYALSYIEALILLYHGLCFISTTVVFSGAWEQLSERGGHDFLKVLLR